MRSQLKWLAHGLQILAGEVPGHDRGIFSKDLREVSQLLACCRRDADKLKLPK